MYYYIYDEFVSNKKYERELIAIENRLADLGIAGRVARLALFKHAEALIADELRRGQIETVVVVGNDQTVHKVSDAISGYDVALGLIPLGTDNQFAKMLGIPLGVAAVDILSARNIEVIDVGRLNGQRFVTGVCFPRQIGTVICDNRFTMKTERAGVIEVRNLACEADPSGGMGNPTDGLLETVIAVEPKSFFFHRASSRKKSVVGSKEIEIDFPETVIATADGKKVESSHFSITVEPLALKVITGKERMF
ncbi:TPA: hypothetical protein DDZ10_05010 [Candidatus Uhrbacteria bacterium]|nr:MAG: YegS//BmrU family lipid kinase [Parcubacteria group bacterium GW2011_GWA2_53_21]HBL39993.1 hypothetical protein [Candidatus Uhrbacteria bacterium]